MIKILIEINWNNSSNNDKIMYIISYIETISGPYPTTLLRVKPEFTDNFKKWAKQNLKSSYEYKDHNGEYDYQQGYICFDNDEDATLFKLTWEY